MPYSNDRVPLESSQERIDEWRYLEGSLADHFGEHIFMKDKEDVFMALVKEIPCVQEVVTSFYIVSYYLK